MLCSKFSTRPHGHSTRHRWTFIFVGCKYALVSVYFDREGERAPEAARYRGCVDDVRRVCLANAVARRW